jgi:hypothetical protein
LSPEQIKWMILLRWRNRANRGVTADLTCGRTRGALGNWSTHITALRP